jgi:uncharacterized membrane protein
MLRQSVSLPRWVVALCWISLVVNIFLVSAIATHWATQWLAPNAIQRGEAVDRPMARLLARLPREDARIVRELHRDQRARIVAARAEYDAALAAAGRAVAREPLDEAVVAQALEEVRRKRQVITDVRVQLYAQIIPKLSKEGRRLVAAPD